MLSKSGKQRTKRISTKRYCKRMYQMKITELNNTVTKLENLMKGFNRRVDEVKVSESP